LGYPRDPQEELVCGCGDSLGSFDQDQTKKKRPALLVAGRDRFGALCFVKRQTGSQVRFVNSADPSLTDRRSALNLISFEGPGSPAPRYWQGQGLSEKQSDQPAARNGIFAAGDWRAESASETISPHRDRKSETTTREKWPQKPSSCLQVLISRFRRTGWWRPNGSRLDAHHSVYRTSLRYEPGTGIFDAETRRQNQRFWQVFNSRDCANQKTRDACL
jgi:hypothetical protein